MKRKRRHRFIIAASAAVARIVTLSKKLAGASAHGGMSAGRKLRYFALEAADLNRRRLLNNAPWRPKYRRMLRDGLSAGRKP